MYSLGLTLKAASFGRPVEEVANGPTWEADTGSPLFPKWWRILNKATHPDVTRRYRSAKAFLNDLQSLRLQIAVSVFSWKRLFFVGLAAVGLALLIFVSLRVIEERANIAKTRQTVQKIKVDIEKATKELER